MQSGADWSHGLAITPLLLRSLCVHDLTWPLIAASGCVSLAALPHAERETDKENLVLEREERGARSKPKSSEEGRVVEVEEEACIYEQQADRRDVWSSAPAEPRRGGCVVVRPPHRLLSAASADYHDSDHEQLVRVREDSHSSTMGGRGGGEEGEKQELSRLGSRPPCCKRKCGECEPCKAVQVRAGAEEGAAGRLRPQCANYEPVGWKCKCGAAVFDP
ncbi:hypothetical protein ACP70R_030996 [Stipagrostis hirtigluma subsp. patula]